MRTTVSPVDVIGFLHERGITLTWDQAAGTLKADAAKLHRWAVADPGRRFDDLFNFVTTRRR